MALGSNQPLTEMSPRNLPEGKGRPALKADNLTAICEPLVLKMWEPRRLTTLWASKDCCRPSFTFYKCIELLICCYSYTEALARLSVPQTMPHWRICRPVQVQGLRAYSAEHHAYSTNVCDSLRSRRASVAFILRNITCLNLK
jgi:hypothetical protein